MFVIFLSFITIALTLFYIDFTIPAILISAFGGLACLERGFRSFAEAVTFQAKALSGLFMLVSVLPFITLIFA